MPEEVRRRRSAKYEALDAERRAEAEESARMEEKRRKQEEAEAAQAAAEAAEPTPTPKPEPEEASAPDAKPETYVSDTGSLRYRVGNENRANARFGEAQRLAASQPNQVYYPYQMSGANQPVQAEPYYQSGAWQTQQQPYSAWQTGAGGYAAYQSGEEPAAEPQSQPTVVYYPQREAERAGKQGSKRNGGKAKKTGRKCPVWVFPSLAGGVLVLLSLAFLFVVLPMIQNARDDAKAEEASRERAAAVAVYDAVYCDNVFVDGISLGGMSQQEARDAVTRQSAATFSWAVELTFNGETIRTVNESDVGIHIDIERALEEAWNQGHIGDAEMRWQQMESLESTPYEGYSATVSEDTSRLDAILAMIAQEHYVPAVDATFAGFNADATDPFSFNPEVYGTMLDTEGMKAALEHMAENRESGSLELKLIRLAPAVTEASLRAERYVLRGRATTPISMTKSTEDRNNNIRRAFELISGTVIQPGGKFSFNDIVGKRTIENGFFPAEEYANGKHEDGIGGGVCQASTTIYQAAVRANMQIDKRTPHSMAVNYTDYGKDATVYWWNGRGGQKLDFAFTNTTDYPIYIKAAVQSSDKNKKNLVCNVWIYGQAMEPGVTYDLATQENPIPVPETEYVRDKNAKYVTYEDEQYEFQKAEEGTEVLRWLVRYVNGKEVERTQLETDTYAPKPQIIYVGTRKRPE